MAIQPLKCSQLKKIILSSPARSFEEKNLEYSTSFQFIASNPWQLNISSVCCN